MGEAKRRKLLDPNYGKVRQLTPQQKQALKSIEEIESSLIKLFTSSYEEQGRGCLFYGSDNDSMSYVPLAKLLDSKEKGWVKGFSNDIVDDDINGIIDFVEHYNPEKCGVYCQIDLTVQDPSDVFDVKLLPFGSMRRLALKNMGISTSIDLSEYVDQDLLTRIDSEDFNSSESLLEACLSM